MVDFEEGRVSVRLSENTFYALQRDVANFCFLAKNEGYNENGFYNIILPALHRNRLEEEERLRRLLDNNLSNRIKAEMRNDCYSKIYDVLYKFQFEDKGSKFRQAKIDIRLSKENMDLFAGVFSLMKEKGISKSAYIRMLLNQYVSMRTDKREYLCYGRRYDELEKLASERVAIEYDNAGCVEEFWPIAVDLCCFDGEYYVVGIVPKDSNIILKAYRLCEFKKYKNSHHKYIIDDEVMRDANKIVVSFAYFKKPLHYLRGKENDNN